MNCLCNHKCLTRCQISAASVYLCALFSGWGLYSTVGWEQLSVSLRAIKHHTQDLVQKEGRMKLKAAVNDFLPLEGRKNVKLIVYLFITILGNPLIYTSCINRTIQVSCCTDPSNYLPGCIPQSPEKNTVDPRVDRSSSLDVQLNQPLVHTVSLPLVSVECYLPV